MLSPETMLDYLMFYQGDADVHNVDICYGSLSLIIVSTRALLLSFSSQKKKTHLFNHEAHYHLSQVMIYLNSLMSATINVLHKYTHTPTCGDCGCVLQHYAKPKSVRWRVCPVHSDKTHWHWLTFEKTSIWYATCNPKCPRGSLYGCLF